MQAESQKRRMYIPLHLLVFLYTITQAYGDCFNFNCSQMPYQEQLVQCSLNWTTEFNECTRLNVSHKTISKIIVSPKSIFKKLQHLDMSYNKLEELPESFLKDATALVTLSLINNKLMKLPKFFLNKSEKMEILKLEGNNLMSIPSTVFQQTLRNLTVDCVCSLALSISQSVSSRCVNSSNCHVQDIKCKLDSTSYTLNEFLLEKCGSIKLLAIYITIPILLLCLILGIAAYFVYKRMMKSTDFESKGSPEKSPAHMQPRYITRNKDSITQASTQMSGERKDYENVMVTGPIKNCEIKPYEWLDCETQIGKSHVDVEEGIYLESDVNEGDQPIYSNTQPTYYSYTEPSTINNEHKEDEDVYILPDH
uniref:Uncharacterized protein n=1 Tax=Leptobrachium leishanense TaxID=445787 RepID=A0A8C5PAC4_9ANUR